MSIKVRYGYAKHPPEHKFLDGVKIEKKTEK